MKVKKFRLRPRLPSVGRILKTHLALRSLPDDLEQSIPQEAEQFLRRALPAAFYLTWSRGEIPAPFVATLNGSDLKNAIAVSAVVATIGSQPEEYLASLLMEGETQRSHVVTALCEDSADFSLQFILRLLAEEAEGDTCDVGDAYRVTEAALMTETLTALEAATEGVSVDAAGHLIPRFTRVALIPWWPKKKKKQAAALQRRSA